MSNAQLTANAGEWSTHFGGRNSSVHVFDTDPTNSDRSTAHTVAFMANHARAGAESKEVTEARDEILSNLSEDATEQQLLEATFEYIKDRVRFVEDEKIVKKLFNLGDDKELLIT